MPHPLQMFYGNLSQLGKKSNSVIRSRSVKGSKIGVMPDQWRVSLYMIMFKVTFGRGNLILFDDIPISTIEFQIETSTQQNVQRTFTIRKTCVKRTL